MSSPLRLRLGATRLAASRGAASQLRPLCSAASSGLHAALERHKIPPRAVPDGADAHAVLRQLRLLETLGVPNVARTVQRDPSVLTRDATAVANQHVEYLLSLGIPHVGPMIEAAPQLLSCDLTHDLHRKVTILQALGVRKIGPWLYKNRGRLVSMDVERDLRPSIEFLQSLPGCEVHKVLEGLPKDVFGKGRREQMEKRVSYLTNVVGVDHAFVGRMLSKLPTVLTMSIKNMIAPKVRCRRQRCARSRHAAVGARRDDVGLATPSAIMTCVPARARFHRSSAAGGVAELDRDLGRAPVDRPPPVNPQPAHRDT